MAKWMLRQTTTDIQQLARQTGVSPVLARILAVRGYQNEQSIKSFIDEKPTPLADPFGFMDMDKAVAITAAALSKKQHIAIFGDYDVDGMTSTVILYQTIKSLGGSVEYYVPSREDEGYGLNCEALDMLKDSGAELVIACDNGISAFEETSHAAKIGLPIIILDHHAVMKDDAGNEMLPEALAIVDAKRSECKYHFDAYCAAAVCYRFSEALYTYLKLDWHELEEYFLPLVTLATVCDLVDLVGENRDLVKRGLKLIPKSRILGIQALLKATELTGKELDTYHVSFVIGPCINAAGRLKTADIAIELLLSEDMETAENIAAELVELNKYRRQLSENGANLAYEIIASQHLDQNKIIVIYSPEFFESVSGIIAGRIKERYNRPTIIIAGKNAVLHGSCRSIEGYDIFAGLSECKDLFVTYGGHPMAAGLSIKKENVAKLNEQINRLCQLSEEDMQPHYRIDCPLDISATSLNLARELALMAPFGKENPMPLLAAKNICIDKITLLGKEENVMRLHLREAAGRLAEAIDFSGKDKLKTYIEDNFPANYWQDLLAGQGRNDVLIDLLYSLHVNSFNGRESARIQVVDFRAASQT